jgi:hypothetical protein
LLPGIFVGAIFRRSPPPVRLFPGSFRLRHPYGRYDRPAEISLGFLPVLIVICEPVFSRFLSGPSGFCLAAETGYPGSVIFGRMFDPPSMHPYQFNSGPKPFCFLKPCDSVFERSFPVFVELLNIRYLSGTRSIRSAFGSLDALTRRSE